MWDIYKKAAPYTQATILVICLGMYFLGSVPLPNVLFFFLLMQVFALVGARWGLRLKRRVNRKNDSLPLQGKL